MTTSNHELEIAVIGMACRFPGADGIEAFWENLRQGRESVSFFTDEELRGSGIPPEIFEHPSYVRAAGVIEDVDRFDASFFGFTAREAQALDPQHRLFLELSWTALEQAGYDPDRYPGPVGVFAGSSQSMHFWKLLTNARTRETVSGVQAHISTDKDFLASRVAYKLNLGGPAVAIQTACSTSLAAVHLACQSLLAGECDMALAGGVSILVPQKVGYLHEPDGILSVDGHCRAFDAEASGTTRGSGAGIVVLKRLADAFRDGDRIEAVVKGWAMNNDGGQRVGFTAPGVQGQARVVRLAQAMADVEPDSIGYVEAHGTGTSLGDPIEIAALTQVFGATTQRKGFCAIGSVKTNIGHLDAAAGVAGLIKTVLMLKHRQLVPSLHFRAPNPRIDLAGSPFYVSTRTTEWPADGRPRRAGVSAFGIGGTNVHVVLEEAAEPPPPSPAVGPEVLVVSARTAAGLERATDRLAEHLERHPELSLADVAFTLRAGRHPFAHRRAVVCRDLPGGAEALAARDPQRVWSGLVPEEGRSVAFLFTGQGSQYPNMGRGLYESEPVFRTEVDACCERLEPLLMLDLRQLMYADADSLASAAERLNETRFTQPALFTVEYALARLWRSWGVVPEAMIGHSVGELVAACLSGVMTRDDALALVAERARLMQACPRGAMLAVALSEDAVRPLLRGSLEISVVNGPEACVVGGPVEEVDRLAAELLEKDVPSSPVPTSHAFHSALMQPATLPFAARVAERRLERPRIPFVSNVTGTWITPEEATAPAYWARQMASPVRFAEGIEELLRDPRRVLLEIGPGHTLISLAKRRFTPGSKGLALASLRHPRDQEKDVFFLRQTAARLWTAGVAIDWGKGSVLAGRRRALLPTYPFEGERYPTDAPATSGATAPRPAKRARVDQWLYVPSWRRSELIVPPGTRKPAEWCVFGEVGGPGDLLIEILRGEGASVSVVRPGAGFAREDEREWVVDPLCRADYEQVVAQMQVAGDLPDRFVHFWGGQGQLSPSSGGRDLVDPGLLSVLHLAQALGPLQSRETVVTVVTSAALEVTGAEPLSPRRATVLGLCRVISQEYPLLSCRNLDVEALAPAAQVAEQVRSEAGPWGSDTVVAYRGRYRWVQCFDPIGFRPQPEDAGRLRTGGIYLITGGLGKVGLALAEHLARNFKARLVLLGRSGLPEPALWEERLATATADDPEAARVRAVRELRALGSEVLVVCADVVDREAMRNALALTRDRFGGLHGVIHAAGDLAAGVMRPMAQAGVADFEAQLRPKARGAEILDELLGDTPLDFVLLTSSLSAVLGGLGFAAYAAANACLDAFARRQHQKGRRAWISVGWDGWRFGPRSDGAAGSEAALEAMSAREGGEAFARILDLALLPQVVVSTIPLGERLEKWTGVMVPEEEADEAGSADASLHARPALHTVYVAPEDPTERRVAELWGQLLGIDRVGVDDNFFELGGSSLLAVHLMGRLKKEFAAALSVATLFEAPTVRALSRMIRAPGGAADELERSQGRGRMRRLNHRGQGRTSDAAVE